MMGVWNARLLDDSLHKALYGRGKALYQSTHHYKDFGLLVPAQTGLRKACCANEITKHGGKGEWQTSVQSLPLMHFTTGVAVGETRTLFGVNQPQRFAIFRWL